MSKTFKSDHFDTDVIIIGAGPIGLSTACALAHHGVNFRLFEQRLEPKPHSRANNVWARPQELLASIGIRDALAEKSYRHRKVKGLGSKVSAVALAYAACRRAILFHICIAAALSSR
ncbi:FAD-dependent oxidoreductase [Agrobacterium sp. rho-8.1]